MEGSAVRPTSRPANIGRRMCRIGPRTAFATGRRSPAASRCLPMPPVLRVAIVDQLVDIGRLEELKEVMLTPDVLRIGALITPCRYRGRKTYPDVTNGFDAASCRRDLLSRHSPPTGTIGGSVALRRPGRGLAWLSDGRSAPWVRIAGPLRRAVPSRWRTSSRGNMQPRLPLGEIVLGFEGAAAACVALGDFAKSGPPRAAPLPNSIAVAGDVR